ncbi:MAG: exodeoxyribonuclease VII small subunit [Gemmatimonadota bacterium]
MTQEEAGEGSAPREEAVGENADAGMTLEERLNRLDEIVAGLEGGDVELEVGLELFEEGVRHIRRAEGILAEAELRVEELLGEGDALGAQPFGEDGG